MDELGRHCAKWSKLNTKSKCCAIFLHARSKRYWAQSNRIKMAANTGGSRLEKWEEVGQRIQICRYVGWMRTEIKCTK
jgi:hypothetical protein